MRAKATATIVILAVSAALFVAVRSANRADASASNCYSEAPGPNTPIICS